MHLAMHTCVYWRFLSRVYVAFVWFLSSLSAYSLWSLVSEYLDISGCFSMSTEDAMRQVARIRSLVRVARGERERGGGV